MNKPERDPQTFAIIGAAMEVHSQLGSGFLEAVYQDALKLELSLRGILFACEVPLEIRYKGTVLPHTYRADLICYDSIIVELKALSRLTSIEEAQVIHYLKITGMQRGLLINFGASRLEYKRLVNGYVEKISADLPDERKYG